MALFAFRETPLGVSTRIGRVFKFIGNGVQTSFPVTSGIDVGEVIMVGNIAKYRAFGGFSISGNNVIFPTAPGVGVIVIIPEKQRFLSRAYDQNTVPGVPFPRVDERALWIGDVDEIQFYTYYNSQGNTGIKISMNDLDTGAGAAANWFQFAPSLPDGSPGSYGAAGVPIQVDPIRALSTVAVDASSGSTSITLTSGTDFVIGQYVQFEPTSGNDEVLRVTNKVGNVLTLQAGTNNTHLAGSNVYACAVKVWVKLTIPSGASGGININLFDTVPQVIYDQANRS